MEKVKLYIQNEYMRNADILELCGIDAVWQSSKTSGELEQNKSRGG